MMMINTASTYNDQQAAGQLLEVAEELDLDFYFSNNNNINELMITPSPLLNNTFTNATSTDLQLSSIEDNFYYTGENYTDYDLFPYLSSYSSSSFDPLLSFISPDITPLDIDDQYSNSTYNHYPKRQKTYNYNCCSDFTLNNFNGYSLNNYPSPQFLPELLFPPTTTEIPSAVPVCSNGYVENGNKKPSNGYLSAQSAAARQRRRKISEKTQQLGKLVPGGSKMNTAEMFQAAFKYIKFLQAQIGIIELMGSTQENKNLLSSPHDLEVLLASSTIQEKLYSEEKCLIPRDFVEILAKDREIQTNPLISKDINSLVPLET